jgi:integrase
MRVFARRERPHPGAQLSLFEAADGWRHSLHVTNRALDTKGWLGQCAYIDAAHVRRPRVDYESHTTALDRNEVGALLVAAGLGPAVEHALISLLALNGLRVSEATGADIEHLGRVTRHAAISKQAPRHLRRTSCSPRGRRLLAGVPRS